MSNVTTFNAFLENPDLLNQTKVSQLKKLLSENNLPKHGRKKHLIHRLKSFFIEEILKERDEHVSVSNSSSSSSPSSPPCSSKSEDMSLDRETTSSSWPTVSNETSVSFQFPVLLEDTKKGSATLSGIGILSKKLWNNTIGPILGQKQLSSGKWLIGCTSADQQKSLLKCESLAGITIKCSVPEVFTEGVIKPIPLETNLLELQREFTNVKSMKRLKNKDGSESRAVKITFLTRSLPKQISLGYQSFAVKSYVPQVFRCTRCNRLGHTKNACRAKQVCGRCGLPGHDAHTCEHAKKCVNCQGNHAASFPGCPEYKIRVLAGKIKSSSHMPYVEAIALARAQSVNQDVDSRSLAGEETVKPTTTNPKSYALALRNGITKSPVRDIPPTVIAKNVHGKLLHGSKHPLETDKTDKDRVTLEDRTDNKQENNKSGKSSSCSAQSTPLRKYISSQQSASDQTSSCSEQSTPSCKTPVNTHQPTFVKTNSSQRKESISPVSAISDPSDFVLGSIITFLENLSYQFVSIMKNITGVMTSSISELKSILSNCRVNSK